MDLWLLIQPELHDGVTMPGSLQSWIFSLGFKLSFHEVVLPCSPQTLTFGFRFNLSLRGVAPKLLWTSTFVTVSR
jgi:hypothetical protein